MSDVKRWSAKPFVSYDAPDDNGNRAELLVIKGYGTPSLKMESDSGKATSYQFKVDNTKFQIAGWITKEQTELIDKMEYAITNKLNMEFRIEIKRNKKFESMEDRLIPINQLKEENPANVIRNIAGVKMDGEDSFTYSKFAMTNPTEDPGNGSFGSTSALNMDPSLLAVPGKDTKKTLGQVPSSSRPYELYNADGTPNVGSYGYNVGFATIQFVLDHMRNSGNDFSKEIFSNVKLVSFTAKEIVDISNQLQHAMMGDRLNKSDLQDASHAKARGMIYEAIRVIGLDELTMKSVNEDKKEELGSEMTVKEWGQKVLETANQFLEANDKIFRATHDKAFG